MRIQTGHCRPAPWPVRGLFVACSLLVRRLFAVCSLFVHRLFAACSNLEPYQPANCGLRIANCEPQATAMRITAQHHLVTIVDWLAVARPSRRHRTLSMHMSRHLAHLDTAMIIVIVIVVVVCVVILLIMPIILILSIILILTLTLTQ